MSKTINSLLLAHLRGEKTTLALCWRITKKNGELVLGTDHDLDVVVGTGALAGNYKAGANVSGSDVASSSDMSVDNTEVNGSFNDSIVLKDITAADIKSGVLSNAPVTLFYLNWADTTMGQAYIRSGFLGEMTWDSGSAYKTELRGLTQLLSQTVVQTYAVTCNVIRFGDARCKVDVASLSITATVTAVTNRRVFTVSGITSQPPGYFSNGTLLGLTGENTGFTKQIRLDVTAGTHGKLTLFEAFPEDVHVGDTYTMRPGCDRAYSTCKTFPNPVDPTDPTGNTVNFKGYGLFIPGIDAIMRGAIGTAAPVSDPSSGGSAWAPSKPGV